MKRKEIVSLVTILFILIIPLIANNSSKSSALENFKPVIVLVERNPWLMVIGSDSPVFALYNNGTLIYYEKDKGYFSSKLNKEQMIKYIPNKNFKKLKTYYSTSDWTDQPTNTIYFWENNIKYSVTVYGSLRKAKEERKKTPKEFLEIYDKLIKKVNYKGAKWLPKYLEVMIWPFEYSKDNPIKWPSNWPNLKHNMTKKRGKGSYSLYLDSKYFDGLVKFMKNKRPTQAVLIGNKKYAVSYRYPFPKEGMWMK